MSVIAVLIKFILGIGGLANPLGFDFLFHTVDFRSIINYISFFVREGTWNEVWLGDYPLSQVFFRRGLLISRPGKYFKHAREGLPGD
jgi:hypothetical protein